MTRTFANRMPTRDGIARILVVDDHPIMRQGYYQLISQQSDLEMCGEAADVQEALRQVEATHPDLVIIDISLKDSNGIELMKQLRARDTGLKMLVVSMHDESLFAERALHAGASGYINKEETTDKLIDAVRHVLAGKIFLSPAMTERMLSRAAGNTEDLEQSPLACLSDRELEVFELIGKGLTTRKIASKLHLSSKTVDTYRQNIKTKLNLSNATELTLHAAQWALRDT